MRLDHALVERKLVESRTKAQELIALGLVSINGVVATKSHKEVSSADKIEVTGTLPYVSRGGLKLAHALKEFHIDPKNLICLDAGASTGGFTDCLIKHGANKVYAVDVGRDQLAPILRTNPRVISLEQTDIRALTLPEQVDMIVADLSFISLTHILPVLAKFIQEGGTIIALVKPQFEVGKEYIEKQGIVKDLEVRGEALKKILHAGDTLGWKLIGATESPITGGTGNVEYLACWRT